MLLLITGAVRLLRCTLMHFLHGNVADRATRTHKTSCKKITTYQPIIGDGLSVAVED